MNQCLERRAVRGDLVEGWAAWLQQRSGRQVNARLRVVDCGHLFLLTRASVLAAEIEAFLSEN